MNQHQSSPFLEGGIHVVVVMHQQQRGLFLKIWIHLVGQIEPVASNYEAEVLRAELDYSYRVLCNEYGPWYSNNFPEYEL